MKTPNPSFTGYILLNRDELRPPKLHARSAAQAGERIEGLPEFAHEVRDMNMRGFDIDTESSRYQFLCRVFK